MSGSVARAGRATSPIATVFVAAVLLIAGAAAEPLDRDGGEPFLSGRGLY